MGEERRVKANRGKETRGKECKGKDNTVEERE